MTIYLLATQTLLDVLAGEERINAWLHEVPMREVEISAVSIGQAHTMIQQVENAAARENLERQLSKVVTIARACQGVIPFDEGAARVWASLQEPTLTYQRPDGAETELSSESRMVVATALARGATLVEAKQPYHDAIPDLSVVSP
jgi:predicted nucleic acid-binding protein